MNNSKCQNILKNLSRLGNVNIKFSMKILFLYDYFKSKLTKTDIGSVFQIIKDNKRAIENGFPKGFNKIS